MTDPRRVLARFLKAEVVPFKPKVKNPHFVKIHNERYFLSDDGGPLGTAEEMEELAGNARVIVGPGAGKFKYLWVYDVDKQIVAMWRVTDGNEKVWERASGMQAKLVRLDKRSQLNRVDNPAFRIIEREMRSREHEQMEAMRRSIKENETADQAAVNDLTQQYFDQQVRPLIERAVADVQAGAVPMGYRSFGAPADAQRHMTTSAMGRVFSTVFTVTKVEEFVRQQGLDLDAPGVDIQAVEWAVQERIEAAYQEYLPPLAGD
jgi:hypothetical protein